MSEAEKIDSGKACNVQGSKLEHTSGQAPRPVNSGGVKGKTKIGWCSAHQSSRTYITK